MSQLHDELAARALLTELTAGQPPAPPDRTSSVRRRVVLRRRRQLAAVAAAIVVLAAAAATVPLGLLHAVFAPPAAPTAYRVTEQRPARGDFAGVVASGTIDGKGWNALVTPESGSGRNGTGLCFRIYPAPTLSMSCVDGPVQGATRTGTPANMSLGLQWGSWALDLGTVRSDVTALLVTYTNGQVLTVYPRSVFGRGKASYVALATPHDGSVVSVTAFAGARDLGYAVPFSGQPGLLDLVRWLGPDQAALPAPATRIIGSGSVSGSAWTEQVSIGPWGTCLHGSGGGSVCASVAGSELSRGQLVNPIGGVSFQGGSLRIYPGEAAPSVSYLVLTLQDHSTVRIPTVSLRGRRFFACADAQGNRIVSWAAYSAAGHRLAAGRSLL
jgi:hypothetical protein